VEAERKMGELLKKTERQKPGEYKRLHDVTVSPTLAEIGVSKRESAQAQELAEIPLETFFEFSKTQTVKGKDDRLFSWVSR